ncbi:hypothetical protein [Actinoplanes sp. NPDC026619]|uniref:hypothetical protein n=1 Tax=Actinoplanes sp. NPDC026619 TaxID=3155798 RepID=UPI0033C1FA7E
MRSDDDLMVRTALPDISSEFAALLAGTDKIELRPPTALDASLARIRRGDHNSEFVSAAPDDTSGSETG